MATCKPAKFPPILGNPDMSTSVIAASMFRELILPPSSLFLIIVAGFMLRWRWLGFGQAVSRAALIALVVLCTSAGAQLFVAPLERLTAPLASFSGTGAQAIVVLAAGHLANAPEYGNKDIPDYIALARLRYAAKLHHETRLPVLVSGGNGTSDGAIESKALGMARALRDEFATPVKWIEGQSSNTAENAEFSAAILKREGVQRILLVTDAMHMPRSQRVFAQSGLEVVAAPTMFFSLHALAPVHFLPSAEGLRRSYYAIYEWIGIIWYRIRPAIVHR